MASDERTGEKKNVKIVFAEFDGWIQESGELFDTTHQDLAKEKNIFNEKAVYEPLPLLIGSDRLFPGLEKSMATAEVGKDYEIIIPSNEAAGPRDPKLVDLLPIREFLKQEIVPEVGLQVTVKNKTGYISAVTAGRVRVDFNNRLAGKTLKYNYKIVSEPSTDDEKLKAVIKMDYGNPEGFSAEFDGKKVIVKLPDVCKYDQKWLLSKFRVVTDLREILGMEVVSFVEEYAKAEKNEEKTEELKAAEHDHDHDHEHNHAHEDESNKSKKAPKKDRPEEEVIE